MTCKKCNQYLSEREISEILDQLVDGLKPERICEACIDEYYDEPYPYDGSSDLDHES